MKRKSRRRTRAARRDPGRLLSSVVMLFFFSAFLLLALKDMKWEGFALAAGVPAMIWLGTHVLPRLFPSDKLLLSLTNFLCALGVLVLYATSPATAYRQALYYGVGLVAMVLCVWMVRLVRSWHAPVLLMMPLSLGVLVLPLVLGRETNGATNWIYFAGLSVQPSELVKISLLLILSFYMSRHRMLPWLGFSVACLGVLMLQKDLGTALLYYGVTLMLYFASTGNLALTGLGLAGGGRRGGDGLPHVCPCEEARSSLAQSLGGLQELGVPDCAGTYGACQRRPHRCGAGAGHTHIHSRV